MTRPRLLRVSVHGHRWAINRPYVQGGWVDYDEGEWFAALSWGNGNSDPVWGIDLEGRVPGWRWLRR